MLWGGKAQAFLDYIDRKIVVNKDDNIDKDLTKFNVVLKAAHPMAEGYDSSRKDKFTGCKHFYLANKILSFSDKKMVDW